jgi:glucosyl-3-phosphoglycerate synthase
MSGAASPLPGIGQDHGVTHVSPGAPRHFELRRLSNGELVAAKGGRRVSVCLPARNEASTVGTIVGAVRRALVRSAGGAGLVDEIVVVDDVSSDETGEIARRAGARVVRRPDDPGKGRAMRTALDVSTGDIVVFLDADVSNFDPRYITRLVGPLLLHGDVALVKGFYERPLAGRPSEGGRVTELVARPLIELLFPELGDVRQPLAGETAAPRRVLDTVSLEPDYGVELGLLVDVARKFGAGSIGQVDLGVRVHRNRPLPELRPQARDVVRAALARSERGSPTVR